MMSRLVPGFLLCLLLAALGLSRSAVAGQVSVSHGGLTLNANLETADGKTLKDGVILMTHGTLAHGRMEIMSTLQDNMKARGYNSLSINLSYSLGDRAFAMHDCSLPQTHRHEDAVGEIAAWIGWLKSQGADRIAVLGHSRGGNQTAWYASEEPDAAVKAVILIAPGSWTADYLAKDFKNRFGEELAPVLDAARRQIKAGQGKARLSKANVLYCKDTQTTSEAVVSYHGFDPHLATFDLLHRIAAPVLVIAGSADETTPGVAAKAAPHADGNNIRLVSVDGADHFFRDLYAEDAADAIHSFLQGHGF